MYSWGDDTSVWKKPGGYKYGDAMKPYLDDLSKKAEDEGSRAYTKKKTPGLDLVDPKGRKITTDSEDPILIAVDGTGSMSTWPAEIFDRLPLLYQTLSKYKKGVELSFSVIGDASFDKWPVQISDFGKELTLDKYLNALCPEGGGGPGIRESYELWAHYVNECVTTPKATSPFLILMGDEMFYDIVRPEHAKKYLGQDLQAPVDAMKVWKSLAQKYDIYLLRKQYDGHDSKIEAQWNAALGAQRIIPVYDPTRVVDVAMGIIAKRWGKFSDFEKNLASRQDEEEIAVVMDSLKAAPAAPTIADGVNSVTKGSKGGKGSKAVKSKLLA